MKIFNIYLFQYIYENTINYTIDHMDTKLLKIHHDHMIFQIIMV